METSYISKRTPETQRSINQTLKKKTVYRVKRTKPVKITLIGDSHIKGLAELRNLMGREYSISSTFMPGAYLLTYLLTPWSRVLLEKLTSELCS
jgi:hypothetical protein